jgi:hypothetical protein
MMLRRLGIWFQRQPIGLMGEAEAEAGEMSCSFLIAKIMCVR